MPKPSLIRLSMGGAQVDISRCANAPSPSTYQEGMQPVTGTQRTVCNTVGCELGPVPNVEHSMLGAVMLDVHAFTRNTDGWHVPDLTRLSEA